MSLEIKKLLFEAEELGNKIRFGRDAIEKARSKGKDIGNWEEIIDQLENEREELLSKIADLITNDFQE